MHISNQYYLIIDLEATCCNQGTIPSREMEIIEIGAVLLDRQSLEIDDEFQRFVKPVRNPQLTAFCTELTSIPQTEVDSASLFPDVMDEMSAWLADCPGYLFCSWGAYDRNQFVRDCDHHRVPYPFHGHLNIKKAFSEALKTNKRFGLGSAVRRMGLKFEGTAHRGIDDARNIAAVVRAVLQQE